tara:strand:- start:340 stop:618 length:279 start_codon:yes stop_codon:yes gene_type:complete
MNRNQNYEAGRAYKRTSEVKVSSGFGEKIEALALGHFAMGNIGEFQVGMTAISKTSPEQRLEKMERTLAMVAKSVGLNNASIEAGDIEGDGS